MRIEITKELKIKLLQAMKNGYIDTDELPELSIPEYMKNLTDEELDAKIASLAAILEQIGWDDLKKQGKTGGK